MEIPIRCPLCDDILLTEYNPGGYIFKSCMNRLNHTFSCGGRPFETENVQLVYISVGAYRELLIRWDLWRKSTTVQKRLLSSDLNTITDEMELPFIDIDVIDIPKAVDKIKSLLPFA